MITADAAKQFMAKEFKQYNANMGIIAKNAPVEAYYAIGIVEHYHGTLQQVYSFITTKIPGIELDLALQISFKAINNSRSFNRLVPILLVFGAYLRMIGQHIPSLSITEHAIAI